MQRALASRLKIRLHAIPAPTSTRTICHSRYAPTSSAIVHASSILPSFQTKLCAVRHLSIKSRRDAEGKRSRPSRPARDRGKSPPPKVAKANELAEIIETLDLPTEKDIANLPRDILTQPAIRLYDYVAGLKEFHERSSSSPAGHIHTISIDDEFIGTIRVMGKASSKQKAKNMAYLKFLAEAHKKGNAAKLFPITAATVDKEKLAMLDVYLFAARYQEIPQISSRQTTRRMISGHEVQVSLPSLGIAVSGRGRSQQFAEVAAALAAKDAIEKYIAAEGSTGGKVEANEVFGLASGVAFCQWYKQQKRGVNIDVRSTSHRSQTHTAKVVVTENSEGDEREFNQVTAGTKKSAEDLAQFVAAISLCRGDPEMRTRFFKEYQQNNYQVLPPVFPVGLDITNEIEDSIHEAIRSSRDALQQLQEDDDMNEEERLRRTIYRPLSSVTYDKKCQELSRRREAYEARDDLAKLRKTRSEYPMNQFTEDVLKTVKSNIYSIIIGATGSGKTTQVPQILMNDAVQQGTGASCNIICTQPRRIAAKSVSQRVADERAEFLGDCVGYHVKGDSKLPNYGGSINFCTTGILTQQLQHHADDIMENASHLIIDEVHERDTIIDFLLTNLRRIIRDRIAAGKKVPHVILMSATIDPDLFASYLQIEMPTGEKIKCPSLSVPGRTFPVREAYLDEIMRQLQKSSSPALHDVDTAKFIAAEQAFTSSNKNSKTLDIEDGGGQTINWAAERRRATAKTPISAEEQEQAMVPHALIAATIGHIAKNTDDGAILTFLPGLEDITKVNELLQLRPEKGIDFTNESKYKIFMLHSSIQDTQREVFNPVPEGCRKIILATNIAETSITIPDVQHVVDTGKLRELQYDQTRRITKLACVWVSKSNAKQRAGRAGRVQDGNYYALYSKERYNSLRAVGLPELLRSDLSEVCLGIKNQGYEVPIKEFLAEAIEPPSMPSVDIAINNLVGLQALNQDETMTALGRLLAQLPVHPSLGKMIVLGIVFRCLDPMLIIGASFAERNIFVQPLEKRQEAREKKDNFSRNTLSDHIGLLAAVKELRMLSEVRGQRAMMDYASRNFLHIGAFRSIVSTAEQIENLLVEQGVVSKTQKTDRLHFQFGDPRLNENSDKVGLIKVLILAGFYPNLGIRRGRIAYRTPQEATALVHPSSINATKLKRKGSEAPPPLSDPKTELLAFSELVRSSDGNNTYLRETTPVTPLMALLFSGLLEQGQSRNILQMDGWLPFYLNKASVLRPLVKLHEMLQAVTTSAFKDLAARRNLADHEDRNRFADALVTVLDHDLANNAKRANRRATDNIKLDPSAAFAAPKNRDQNSRSRPTSQDPKRQEMWDNLISSWAQKQANNTGSKDRTQARPSSAAALFAEGHADLQRSGSGARSRGSWGR